MPQKKPTLEKIYPGPDSSVFVRRTSEQRSSPPFWHFHPELELIYVDKGEGRRHIGNHLSYFHNSQLLLIGANLPHFGFSDKFTRTGSETYIQFREDFLGDSFFRSPEMHSIAELFERAKKGVLFHPAAKAKVGTRIIELVNLDGFYDPLITQFKRFIDENFMDDRHHAMWTVVSKPQEVMKALVEAKKWSADARKFAAM